MNWSKIKTVLIFLFLAIDIFLLVWNIFLQQESKIVDEAAIANTKELLSERGINIPEGIISEDIPDIKRLVVRNAMADEAEFIGNILGKNYVKDGNVFSSENCSVEIKGDSFEITEKIKIKTLSEAEKWLSEKGLKLDNTEKSEYRGEYIFKTMYKGLEVFGSRISVKCDKKETVACGKLYYVVENSETETRLIHATAVLPKLIREGISNCTVSTVTPGYMTVADGSKFTEANANPAYRILLSDGREIFYNATK